MENQLNQQILARQSWLDCIGQLNQINNQYDYDFIDNHQLQFQPSKHQTDTNITCFKPQSITNSSNKQQAFQQDKARKISKTNVCSEQEISSERITFEQIKITYEEGDQKQLQKADKKDKKSVKQSEYSKTYRERKKQNFKILQEQNNFLKKKINQLQFRLREKQLEINRLKYPPIEKDLTVQQLNEEFLSKTNLLLSKTDIDPINYAKTIYTPSDILYKEFLQSYDQHGFGGRRKKNILNYYFNEMLEAMMRDSERYLFLMCNNSQNPNTIDGLKSYEQIDSKFIEVMELNQQKSIRLEYFSKNLHPYMIELKQICVQIYSDFKQIISLIDRVHNFMKQSYLTNMDFARKRIEFENWVDSQKHSKLMRRLRSQWLEYIKYFAENESNKNKKTIKVNKKTKLTCQPDANSN